MLLLLEGLRLEEVHHEGDGHAYRADDYGQHQAADESRHPVLPCEADALLPEQEAREKTLPAHGNGVDELVVVDVGHACFLVIIGGRAVACGSQPSHFRRPCGGSDLTKDMPQHRGPYEVV